MGKSQRQNGSTVREKTAAGGKALSSQPEENASTTTMTNTNTKAHPHKRIMFVSSKVKTVSRRLQDLQDEKSRLEDKIAMINTRKQKQQELLQRYYQPQQQHQQQHQQQQPHKQPQQSQPQQSQPQSEPVKYKKSLPVMTTATKAKILVPYQHHESSNSSVVSSLPSHHGTGGASVYSDDDDDVVSYQQGEEEEEEDYSIVTEQVGYFHKYDARGRRLPQRPLINNEDTKNNDNTFRHFDPNQRELEMRSTAACFYHVNGGNNYNINLMKTDEQQRRRRPSRIVIEWERGTAYVPEANLTFHDEGGGLDCTYLFLQQHYRPTDWSLTALEDSSYNGEDLSFSSNDDTDLAAAPTDIPMVLDLSRLQLWQDGSSDQNSVLSDLNSNCSVSAAVVPSVNNGTTNNNDINIGNSNININSTKKKDSQSMSPSSKRSIKASKRRQKKTTATGLTPKEMVTPDNSPAPYLYRKLNGMDNSGGTLDSNQRQK